MSTRCTTHFIDSHGTDAIIYRHADGYPEGNGVALHRFLEEVKTQTQDTRFGDPSYLAAKYVVWLARAFASDPERPLDFLSVGVVMKDPGDVEFIYTVDCASEGDRPAVKCYKVDGPEAIITPEREVAIPA